MTKLYTVTRAGMYRCCTYGVYSTLKKAKAAAIRAQALEPDSYHTFDISLFKMDVDTIVDDNHYSTNIVSTVAPPVEKGTVLTNQDIKDAVSRGLN